MEYLNNKTYKRGEEIRVELKVPATKVTDEGHVIYEATIADLYTHDGHRIRLWGKAPEVDGEEATIILTGKIQGVGNGDYRPRRGVEGKVPGDTIRWEAFSTLDKPLKVEGDVED